ncbi:MAG: tetratricopeptide repeat protein, partial [Planctomycetota bacterium]
MKVLFSLVTCVIFFAVVELILWVAGVPTLIEREDPFRGFSGLLSVFQKDGDVYRTRRALAGGVFNDQAFLTEKPANGVRLFCLGGSSSYGYPWGAEAAFTSIVGEALGASHLDRRVEAVNASGVSYAMHRMNIVADELLAYRPDVFLVYEGHNEFIEPAMFDELKHRGAARVRVEYLLANSRVYSGMQSVFERVKGGSAPSSRAIEADVRRDQTRTFNPKQKEAVVAEFRWRLERLVRRAQGGGVKVLLSTVPCNLRQWRPEWSILEGLDEPGRRAWGEAFAAGQRALEGRDFAAAAASLEQAARLAPAHAETQFLLGQAYEGLARWDDARRAYQLACDADAKPTRRLSEANQAIRSVARQTGALLVDADQIFEEHSEHGLVGFNLVEDYVHPNREGHELLARCMWQAMEQAGWVGGKNQPDPAVFDKIVLRRHERPLPANPTWLRNQAVVLQNQGRLQAAMDKYRQCLALTPDDPVALLNLGSLLYEAGRSEEAVGFLERLAGLDGENFVARNNLGNALMRLEKFTDAIRRYEEALAIQPEYAQGQANLGAALTRVGELGKATDHFEHALRIEPTSALAHNAYALALAQAGQFPQAIDHFEQALRTRADSPEVHFNLGQTLLRAGRFAAARGHFEQALKIQPNHPGIRFNLGLAQMKTGQIAEAVGSFQEALRIKPDLAEAHYNLGVCLCVQGRPAEG